MPARRKAKSASRLAGIPIEPECERHQPPELTAEVLLPGAVAVENRGDHGRVEAALALERRRRKGLAGERLQRPAQQSLLREATDLERSGEAEREIGDPLVEERDPQLERVGHARAVGLDQ